ncbi:MAG TPA: glycosyltransferase family 2 protein [Dehalococcoidia bacterium]|nr:glycosyltransferase family 2 protein [Dehalococcoidia bacterium]
MDVSVVIVTYNSAAFIGECLRTLEDRTRGVSFETIVVDNASPDGTADIVAREFPGVRLIRRDSNAGLAVAVNEGARLATGDVLVWANPDIRFEEDALTPIVWYLRDHPDVGALGPRLVDPDGSVQLSCRQFPGFRTAIFNRYSLATRLLPWNPVSRAYLMTDFDHATVRDVDWVSGAFMAVPRRVFEELGGLDEGYFLYNEDVDFCQRVHRAGYRVVYFPETQVVHHIGGSSRHAPLRMIVARHRSMWRYYCKYFERNPALDAVTLAGITARCVYLLGWNAVLRLVGRARA